MNSDYQHKAKATESKKYSESKFARNFNGLVYIFHSLMLETKAPSLIFQIQLTI